jgi:ComF family protein
MGLNAFFASIVSFALPPRCPGCGSIEEQDDQFCITCWQALVFLTGPGCVSCNTPMLIGGQECAPCMANPPKHDGVRAALAYGAASRAVVMKLKYGRRPGMARTIGALLERQLPGLEDALFAPVPLHRWRLWSRGYNQSLLIARRLPLKEKRQLLPDLLVRTRATPMLRGLGRLDRAKAVKGAFALNPKYREIVKGQVICLVDDVYTSGATVNACASALKRAGATRVIALCWARVLDEDQTQH